MVLWAIVLLFALPLVSRALHLPAGVGGAWIGTSEFADAAGLAAAQTYGGLAGPETGITGTADQALASYTLIKVIGRDVWIGIWSFVLALIAVTQWEKQESRGQGAARTDLVAVPKICYRISHCLFAYHVHRPYLCAGRLQQGGKTSSRRADYGAAHVGLYL